MIGLPYNEYLQRYGARREALAAVVVEARKNGARIPWSYWHDRPLTVEEYLAAPMISDPICRFDCDIPVDGVATFVFTVGRTGHATSRTARCTSPATRAARPTARRLPLHWPLDDILEAALEMAPPAVGQRRRRARRRRPAAGLRRVLAVRVVLARGARLLPDRRGPPVRGRRRDRQRPPGALPALSGGGALGNGRMHGVPQMLECYLQLSGRAGDRQRPDATVGVACHSSPHFGGAVVYSAEPI